MMSLIEETMYDGMVEYGIATTEEMGLVKAIRGGEWIDVLKDILFVRTGYRTWEQFIDEEYSEEDEEEEEVIDEITALFNGLKARDIAYEIEATDDGLAIFCTGRNWEIFTFGFKYGSRRGMFSIYVNEGDDDGYDFTNANRLLTWIDLGCRPDVYC